MPIYSYIDLKVYQNNLKVFSCPYSLKIEGARYFDYEKYGTFNQVKYLVPMLKDKLKIQLNLSDKEYSEMNFFSLYDYTDVIIS